LFFAQEAVAEQLNVADVLYVRPHVNIPLYASLTLGKETMSAIFLFTATVAAFRKAPLIPFSSEVCSARNNVLNGLNFVLLDDLVFYYLDENFFLVILAQNLIILFQVTKA